MFSGRTTRRFRWQVLRHLLAASLLLSVGLAATCASAWGMSRPMDPDVTTTVAVLLSPSTIVADGISTTIATATVMSGGSPVMGDTVQFSSSDSGDDINGGPGPVDCASTTDANGQCTVTITSSTTAGTPTITATDTSAVPTASGMTTLTQTPGPATSVVVGLSQTSIPANGSSQTKATATVTDANGNLVPGDTIAFGASPTGVGIGTVTNHHNGTYTATITSSKTAGTVAITATDSSVTPNVAGSANLTQTSGSAAKVTVSLSPSSIVANGSSQSTATTTVTDANGNAVTGDTIQFSSSDSGDKINGGTGPVDCTSATNSSGQCSVTITSSTTVGTPTITANDTSVSPAASGHATLTEAAEASLTVLHAAPASSVTNQTVTLTATVSPGQPYTIQPSGSVEFSDSAGPIADCTSVPVTPQQPAAVCLASFAASSSPVQVQASFTPATGTSMTTSMSDTSVTVSAGGTSTGLEVSDNVPEVGQSVTYTAYASPDDSGSAAPTGSIEFLDGTAAISSCTGTTIGSNGLASCTVDYTSAGQHQISARYNGDANFDSSASAAQTVSVSSKPAVVLGTINSTMQWTFYYTSRFTKVMALAVVQAPVGATVVIECQGHGCPFKRRSEKVTRLKHCPPGPQGCHPSSTRRFKLTRGLAGHKLRIGTKLTIEIVQHEWVGKYYRFTIRRSHTPRTQIACLAPGGTRPNVGC